MRVDEFVEKLNLTKILNDVAHELKPLESVKPTFSTNSSTCTFFAPSHYKKSKKYI